MLRYENFEFLYLLLLIPIMLCLLIIYNKWRKNAVNKFSDIEMFKKIAKSYSKKRSKTKNTLTIFIFIFLIIGIANPQIGTKMEEVKREGVDLMIAIDLSNSMLSEDIKPNRLERAKQAISKLIDQLQGDRIGLIVFAGEAYIQLPITTDYSAAKLFLSTINTNLISVQGTEIGKAIDLSIQAFDLKNEQNKAIIIITDGENHDKEAIDKTKEASKLGIFVHTLGMGLKKGGPIPIYNKYGAKTDFRKDKDGNTIVSKLNESLLREIAKNGNGSYIRANNSTSGLATLFKEINAMEKKEIGTMIFTEYKNRFQFFIGIAFILLLLDLLILKKRNNYFNI